MFRSILVPVDVDQESSWTRAIPVAVDLARSQSAELHLVNVVPSFGMSVVGSYFPENYEKETHEAAKSQLAELAAKSVPGDVASKRHVVHGTIYEEILQVADTLGIDLIVMAAHRPELKDYLIGPNAARVVRHAKQSVFVVRD